jgi:hypothetical protein
MQEYKRALLLALFVTLTVTIGACLINPLLTAVEARYSLRHISVYAPLSGFMSHLFISYAMDASQARFAVMMEFFAVQSAISFLLVLLASRFAIGLRYPKRLLTSLFCAIYVVVPGIAIVKTAALIYLPYHATGTPSSAFELESAILQAVLCLPLYAALFFAGFHILTEKDYAGGAASLNR